MKHLFAGAAMCLAAVPAHATTLDFTFSFTEFNVFGAPVIAGVVTGLTDNATSAAASLQITSISDPAQYPSGLVGSFAGFLTNQWTVTNGAVTAVDFFGTFDTNNDFIFEQTLAFSTQVIGQSTAILGDMVNFSVFPGNPGPENAADFVAVAPIPLPAPVWMLLAALGGLALATRRTRRGNAAAAPA